MFFFLPIKVIALFQFSNDNNQSCQSRRWSSRIRGRPRRSHSVRLLGEASDPVRVRVFSLLRRNRTELPHAEGGHGGRRDPTRIDQARRSGIDAYLPLVWPASGSALSFDNSSSSWFQDVVPCGSRRVYKSKPDREQGAQPGGQSFSQQRGRDTGTHRARCTHW